MKDIKPILDTVVSKYNYNTIDYEITEINEESCIVNVYNRDAPGSYLKIEILDNDCCCVLEKVNVGFKSMKRFMDRLVHEL